MHLASVILYIYVKVALAAFAVFILSEIGTSLIRPEYPAWLKSHHEGSNKTPNAGKFILMWLLLCIPITIDMFIAFSKGQTFLERLTLRGIKNEEEKKAQEAKVADARKLLLAVVKDGTFTWHPIEQDGMRALVLVRHVPGYNLLTHVIVIHDLRTGKVDCMRAMPNIHDSLVWFQTFALQEAMDKCIEDYDWAIMCFPGMNDCQRRAWKEAKKAMNADIS